MRQIYLDGEFVTEAEAKIPVMDRGFLFGDAIYEVTALVDGHMIDNDLHLARFARSLSELDIPLPLTLAEIAETQRALIRKNGLTDGTVYMQVSRGVAERDFIPAANITPTFVAFTQPKKLYGTPAQQNGIKVGLLPDPRWNRRDIKTVMLLGQVLAKSTAKAAGFSDTWLHEDGFVTEGASSTAFIVTKDGAIVSRPNSHAILPGCTRRAVMDLVAAEGLSLEERAIAVAEIPDAAEAFLTSASSLVTPIIQVGDHKIGAGAPGPVTRALQELYLAHARNGEKVI